MIIWIAPVLLWLSGKAQDYVDFLRSIPSLLAPKPTGLGVPYIPPFMGGQCANVRYYINVSVTQPRVGRTGTTFNDLQFSAFGPITNVNVAFNSGGSPSVFFTGKNSVGSIFNGSPAIPNLFSNEAFIVDFITLVRADGSSVECGNISNPNPAPLIPDDGLFNPTNPLIADDNGVINPAAIVLAPAFPLALVAAILAGYSAAMQAAQAALSALDAIKKIAEGLESLKDLWEKLKEFLNEWEKNRPKKRDTIRQTYGQLIGDGALDFFPSNNQKYQSIQLDIVITNIPIGRGKYFGSFSPHRYLYKELGYIAFYSTTQGILETHPIQFKRTSLAIPKLAVGFIYHLGLDNQVKGFAFGSFSVEKS